MLKYWQWLICCRYMCLILWHRKGHWLWYTCYLIHKERCVIIRHPPHHFDVVRSTVKWVARVLQLLHILSLSLLTLSQTHAACHSSSTLQSLHCYIYPPPPPFPNASCHSSPPFKSILCYVLPPPPIMHPVTPHLQKPSLLFLLLVFCLFADYLEWLFHDQMSVVV